jgi:pyrroloquinoline quinone biosynthesis protein E
MTDQSSTTPGPPISLLAELSHRCPLRCGYCSNTLVLDPASAELDTATWRRVLVEAADLGVLQVHFSGGEPTVRADLEELVECATGAGLYTNLITAGVLLDRRRIEVLHEAGLAHFQLSIQDSSAPSADKFAGYPGHEKKLEVARWVGETGLALTINAVVHRGNVDNLEDIVELAVELGAQRLEVAHVQYYGWARLNVAALLPTLEQLTRATATVEAARERLRGKLRIDYVVPDFHAQYPKACMDGWGRRFLGVTPTGKVLPCQAAETIPELSFDNVLERSLGDIWYRSTAFERFRGTDWMPELCRTCERREIDWGGCRCQAMAFTGDAAATDPVCELSPLHHLVTAEAERATGSSGSEIIYRSWDYRDGGAPLGFGR